ELERSADGENFSRLATINAKGEASRYSYWDETPVAGLNHYRLKMIDASGNFSHSETVTARVKGTGTFGLEAYPNPVSDVLTVKVFGASATEGTIHVLDVTGKTIRSLTIVDGEARINMSGLAQGAYIIRYTDAAHSETIKVNKH